MLNDCSSLWATLRQIEVSVTPGKSSLVRNVFYAALKKHYGGVADRTGQFGALRGSMQLAKDVEFVDQNPIGRSTRSNPVTYIKAYDEIRKLFADQQLSKQMSYAASHFSFNTDGGRCDCLLLHI